MLQVCHTIGPEKNRFPLEAHPDRSHPQRGPHEGFGKAVVCRNDRMLTFRGIPSYFL